MISSRTITIKIISVNSELKKKDLIDLESLCSDTTTKILAYYHRDMF